MSSVNQASIFKYASLAAANADIANLPSHAVVQVTGDKTYSIDGGVLVAEVTSASEVTFDNTTSGLGGTTVEAALNEIAAASGINANAKRLSSTAYDASANTITLTYSDASTEVLDLSDLEDPDSTTSLVQNLDGTITLTNNDGTTSTISGDLPIVEDQVSHTAADNNVAIATNQRYTLVNDRGLYLKP